MAIGDAYFTGSMSGNRLTIDSRSSDSSDEARRGAYNAKLGVTDPE